MKSELEKIPGVGAAMARRLERIGCPTLDSLRGQDPEELYRLDCLAQGGPVDRCVLYVYRLGTASARRTNRTGGTGKIDKRGPGGCAGASLYRKSCRSVRMPLA